MIAKKDKKIFISALSVLKLSFKKKFDYKILLIRLDSIYSL